MGSGNTRRRRAGTQLKQPSLLGPRFPFFWGRCSPLHLPTPKLTGRITFENRSPKLSSICRFLSRSRQEIWEGEPRTSISLTPCQISLVLYQSRVWPQTQILSCRGWKRQFEGPRLENHQLPSCLLSGAVRSEQNRPRCAVL